MDYEHQINTLRVLIAQAKRAGLNEYYIDMLERSLRSAEMLNDAEYDPMLFMPSTI